ncbi:MAG: hypothetical protein Tsb0020_51630 [Haliangiales bacterium]
MLIERLSDAAQFAPGYLHMCAVSSERTVSCRGYNAHGELGDGTTTNSIDPPAPSL